MKRFSALAVSLLLCASLLGCTKPANIPPSSPTPEEATPSPVSTPVYTPAPLPTPVVFPTKGYCNGEGVNLRAEPHTDSAIVDIMGENAVVDVVGLKEGWYQLNLGGTTAFAAQRLITLGEPPRKDNMRWGQVIPETAALYISPEKSDLSDKSLAQGDVVKILRAVEQYLHIVYDSPEGLVQRYVQADVIKPISAQDAMAIQAAASPSPEAVAEGPQA